MKTKRINHFKITLDDNNNVTIRPGTMLFKGIRNQSTCYHLPDLDQAESKFNTLVSYARRQGICEFWHRLNNTTHEVYVRFQKIFALKNNGCYVRGLELVNGEFKLTIE